MNKKYWTKEKCQEESLKYYEKIDFLINNASVYVISYKNGWLNEICSHMKVNRIPKSYWTKENSHMVSLKCKNRVEFRNLYWSAYTVSKENNWLDEICSHMKPINNKKRCIYAYEFKDKYVYIGLTSNLKIRNSKHLKEKRSSVFLHIQKNGSKPTLIQLTDYINVKKAKIMEGEFVKKYTQDNWFVLNKVKTGSIGSSIVYWTKDKCLIEALKYNTKTEFKKNCKGAYSSAYYNKWLDEICSHMIQYIKRNYWNNYNNCLNEYIKQGTKFGSCSGAYNAAKRNGWLELFKREIK